MKTPNVTNLLKLAALLSVLALSLTIMLLPLAAQDLKVSPLLTRKQFKLP